MEHAPPPRGYCTSCGYSLQGLTASPTFRCPECGREFDPSDPKTFQLHPRGRVVRWLAKPIGWPLVLLSLAAAGGVMLVSRWKWGTLAPSTIDLIYYLRPAALRHRSTLITRNDWIYTLSMLAAIAICAWWLLRLLGNALARLLTGPKTDPPVHMGRRHAFMALGVAIASAGATLGWPYRLAQQWVAKRMANKSGPWYWLIPNPASLAPPPTNLSSSQISATLRAAVIEMPDARQRGAGLQLLIEQYPAAAMPILTEAVQRESNPDIRALELRLIGLHRDPGTLNLLREFLSHTDPLTRAAAADSVGLVHAPAFEVPFYYEPQWTSRVTITDPPIDLTSLLAQLNPNWGDPELAPYLVTKEKPLAPAIRDQLEKLMLAGPTPLEREAAARAMIAWPPANYSLRVAEWGVWISFDGHLKLIKSLVDEIPPFVHPIGNPLSELRNQLEPTVLTDKPIIHIAVDRPMAIDLQVLISRGRPWFVYPRPDDLTTMQTESWPRLPTSPSATRSNTDASILPPVFLTPLDNVSLRLLPGLNQGYPWLSSWIDGGPAPVVAPTPYWDFIAVGVRWQSVIVSPTFLPWMNPPDVGPDPLFAWWKRLREVPSAWISSRGESEKFLYYDGPTRALTPIAATLKDNSLQLTLTRQDLGQFSQVYQAHPPQSILLIRDCDGRLTGQAIPTPSNWNEKIPNVVLNLADDILHEQHVIDEFRQMLIAAGLTTPEADGLIDAWRPQFFQTPGTRLLIIMARADYDALCPIEIRPKPTQLERVGIILTEFA